MTSHLPRSKAIDRTNITQNSLTMSKKLNTNVKNTESSKTLPGKHHQSSSVLDEEYGTGSTGSLGSLQKKKSFFGSLRHTKKKHKSIDILKRPDSFAEEIDPLRCQDQKEGDAQRIQLLNSVKEGRMSIEEAMKQAEELGVSSSSYQDVVGEETIFNFGVYKYTKNRASCSRRILQFDFQEKVLCTIQKGSRGKKFNFSQIRGFDSETVCHSLEYHFFVQYIVHEKIHEYGYTSNKESYSPGNDTGSEMGKQCHAVDKDGVRFYIYFEDYHDYELDADTTEEKNKICTLLESITHQNKDDETDGVFEAPVFGDKKIIKEGQVEKKGHSAAFLMWPRRWLRVQSGELSYFKVGEENQPALNIIKLGPGQADVKKVEHNGFIITTSKKEYSFRVMAKDTQAETRERDDWVAAIDEGSQMSARRSRAHSFQDQVFTSTVQEQEKYIKDIVKTLQRELEQLTSILSIVNAPIQATVQVKKVKEVVSNMETHAKTGLLSWTMRQLKNRSESSQDLESPIRTPPGSLPRQPSIKSRSSQPSPAITPIDEGYESIATLTRPPTSPSLSGGSQTTYDARPSRIPPVVPERTTSIASNSIPRCPLDNQTLSSQRDYHAATAAQVAPYKTVNITSSTSDPAPRTSNSSSTAQPPLYQQPSSNRSVGQTDPRLECYDNVNIKNRLADDHAGESTSEIEGVTSVDQDNGNEVDAAKRLHHEIDAGGMGCQTLDKAVQERKEFYQEIDNSGVVLLRVQTKDEDSKEDEPTSTAPPAPPPPPGEAPPPPPPPPGMGGAAPPPPPPIGGGNMVLDAALPSKKVPKPKKKLRPFFWNKVPLQMVTQSLWLGAQDRTNNLNLDALEEMFHMEEKEKTLPQASSKPTAKMLLDPKKAHNLGIFLSGFKLTAKQIDEKLSVFKEEEGALPIDHVIALKRFLPTPEEHDMYKNIKEEDIPSLLQEDQFMIKLCEIPDLDKRLDLLLVIMEFPSQYEELAPSVGNVLEACHQLYGSQRFQVILEYVLAIGNYVNGGTNRGGAYGFRLTTLTKMADIRGKDKKDTLLKFLVTELQRTSPDTLLFLEDLKVIPKAADASIKGLSAEVEVMRKDLGKIMKHSGELFLKYQRTEPQDVKLVNDVDTFVAEYEKKLNELCEKCKEMKYIYSKLLARFGEPPTTDSEELFTALSTFVTQFKKTLNEAESGPSAKKRIKLDGLNEAIAARVARLPQKETSSAAEAQASNGSIDTSIDAVDHAKSSSNEVDGQETSKNDFIDSATEEESLSPLSELKPVHTNSPKVVHKKLSVKQASSSPLAAQKLTPRPTKQGYLDKLSGGKHKAPKWDNRYFELTESGHLHYYKKADGKIINTIYLRGSPVSLDEQDPMIIIIKTDERDWSLKAADVEEAKTWKESIEFYTKRTSSS